MCVCGGGGGGGGGGDSEDLPGEVPSVNTVEGDVSI